MLDDNNEEIKIPLGYRLNHQFEHKKKDKKLMRRNFQFQFDLNFVIIDVTEFVPETD